MIFAPARGMMTSMVEKEEKCERCGGDLEPETGLCPACDDVAPKWLVYLVYALVALFVIGLIYRLIWP